MGLGGGFGAMEKGCRAGRWAGDGGGHRGRRRHDGMHQEVEAGGEVGRRST
jgi:hypothetical protein